MDIFSKMHSLDADLAGLVLYVSIVCVYVCVKTSIWWLLFGTLKLFRNQYSGNAWLKRTLIGLFCILLLALGNVLLWTLFSPENDYYRNICIVLLLLAYRITWREIFTLGGIDRGDWNFDKPNLRFFAWNTFLRFNSNFKLKVGLGGRSEEYDEYKDVNPVTYYADDEAMAVYAQQDGQTV